MGEAVNANEVRAIVELVRRAPLQNMDEAEAAARLLNKFVEYCTPKPKKPRKAAAEPT